MQSREENLEGVAATVPAPILRLSKCVIRPYYDDDAQVSAKEANNAKIARYMRNAFPHPYTIKDAEGWIAFTKASSPLLDFAICRPDTQVLIGGIGLKPRTDIEHRTMEVGYWLGEQHWGQGVATEALAAFVKWAFKQFNHVIRLEAKVAADNTGSARVLEKAGFRLEGRMRRAVDKDGEVMDQMLYSVLREEVLEQTWSSS